MLYPSASPNDQRSSSSTESRSALKRRGSYVRAACNTCRARKVACDGKRPQCQKCFDRGIPCSYVTIDAEETQTSALKRKVQELQVDLDNQFEFFQYLTTAPEDAVLGLLRTMRTAQTPPVHTFELREGLTKRIRPSEHATAGAVLPPQHSDFSLELTVCHPNAYPVLAPLATASISINDLFASRRSSLHSSAVSLSSLVNTFTKHPSSVHVKTRQSPEIEMMQPGPVQPHSSVDERLSKLRINYWTRVPITDEFAANVLSLYFKVDHELLGSFDADLFIDDLVNHKSEFCSPFLVAVLLFYGCQLYTAVDLRASAISNTFFSQAEMFWKAERSIDSINTAIAIQIFSWGSLTHGKDKLSVQLLQESRSMAQRMGLLGVPANPASLERFAAMSSEWRSTISHASWGIFTWLTLHSFFYEDEGIVFPPMYPIPGASQVGNSMMQGSDWHLGEPACYKKTIFAALCELCVIGQEVVTIYYQNAEHPTASRVPLAFAESRYHKLLTWAKDLPPELVRSDHSSVGVLVLHLVYHVVIMCVLRPFLGETQNLRTFSAQDSSPRAVFAASLEQLKRLGILSLKNHPQSINTVLASTGYVHICSAVLANRSDPDWKFYFMLCVAYFQDLHTRYQLCEYSTQGILALALINGAISSSEARKIISAVRRRGKHHRDKGQATALFTLDFDQTLTNPDFVKADALMRKFEELTLGEEVTEDENIRPEQIFTKQEPDTGYFCQNYA